MKIIIRTNLKVQSYRDTEHFRTSISDYRNCRFSYFNYGLKAYSYIRHCCSLRII